MATITLRHLPRVSRTLTSGLSAHNGYHRTSTPAPSCARRLSQTSTPRTPGIAFAFDIDGVLLRSSNPLPGAHRALSHLQRHHIPFILLTNGGGKHESERVAELSAKLDVPLDTGMFVQSHTPFADLAASYRNKNVLVVGGDGDSCRQVAERYGFSHVITPADIITANPSLWPFTRALLPHYASIARPLPSPIVPSSPATSLAIDAIFVYNDPRDWGLDATLTLDLLLSSRGVLGTVSTSNNDPALPNRGFQQDSQPPLYFSNPDLWWASDYHLPRLGQGGFREALEGVWAAVTGGEARGVKLQKTIIGKPYHETYAFAEKRLRAHRRVILGKSGKGDGMLRRVYMVGDNPESDIRGANEYKSEGGSEWVSVLVESGVYRGGESKYRPGAVREGVWDAVRWALEREGFGVGDRAGE